MVADHRVSFEKQHVGIAGWRTGALAACARTTVVIRDRLAAGGFGRLGHDVIATCPRLPSATCAAAGRDGGGRVAGWAAG